MRLIDADALANKLIEQFSRKKDLQSEVILNTMLWKLNQAPSVDGEPVVRCKDCVYWDKDTLRHNSNDVAEWDECECEMLANRDRWNEIDRYCCDIHFCADGERKDND